jgi:hypothetical protein
VSADADRVVYALEGLTRAVNDSNMSVGIDWREVFRETGGLVDTQNVADAIEANAVETSRLADAMEAIALVLALKFDVLTVHEEMFFKRQARRGSDG